MSPTVAERVEWSKRLAQGIVGGGYAAEDSVLPVLQEADASGKPLASLLISKGVIPSQLVMGVLSQLSQLPTVDLTADPPDQQAMALIGGTVASQYGAIGWRTSQDQLTVAFGEPPEPADIRALEALAGIRVAPVLADPMVIDAVIHGGIGGNGATSGTAASVALGVDDTMVGHSAAGTVAGSGSSGDQATSEKDASSDYLGVGKVSSNLKPLEIKSGVPLHIDDLLRYAVSVGASDLHITSQRPGMIRLNGALRPIEGCPVLDNTTIREMIFGILPQSHRERFEAEHELDTSHQIAGVGRFRVNVFLQRGTVASVMRAIPHDVPSFESLGVPEVLRSFTELRRGLILVTGPTGSGKSTTLATLVDIINETKPLHIISVEDPIEFLHLADHDRQGTHKR